MRILIVALANSVTTVRWLEQLRGTGWDVHLFPSEWQPHPHAGLRDVTLHDVGLWRPAEADASVRCAGVWPLKRGAYGMQRLAERTGVLPGNRVCRLARTIRRLRPTLVHALEMQRAGYLTLAARELGRGSFPPWVYSAWGSDIYHFGAQPAHAPRIRAVLEACDYLMTDCARDVGLAQSFGFCGEVLGTFPGGGGLDVAAARALRAPGAVAARRVLAVKGYQNDAWGGRGLVALQAVHRCADLLGAYEVVVYSATPAVRDVVRHIQAVAGLNIRCQPQGPHEGMLTLFGRARVALAVGTTDGTPNALLEALALGACPVQSDTVSTAEWVTDGANGLLVPPEDPVAIERALRRALTDDELVERADVANARIVAERAERGRVRGQVCAAYERAAARGAMRTGRLT